MVDDLRISRATYRLAWSVCVVLALLGAIGALAMDTVTTMRDAANELDARRSLDAVAAAVSSIEKRLAATVRDNAVWDDAHAAVESDNPVPWIADNWGSTSADYPLYDGAIVLTPDGRQIAAYLKGKEIDAVNVFGRGIVQQSLYASMNDSDQTVFGFFKINGRIIVAATLSIRAFNEKDAVNKRKTLTFFKILTDEYIQSVSLEFRIEGLTIAALPDPSHFSNSITDGQGKAIAHFVWSRTDPGTVVYNKALPRLIGLGFLLALAVSVVVVHFRRDLRKERDRAAKATYVAAHDHLTGLLNRAGLIDAIEHAPAGSVLHIIDLDGFKGVNDAWGHAIGDSLLRSVAATLETTTPKALALGRIGGDEFAFLQANIADPERIGSGLIEALKRPVDIDGHMIEVGASIGYAMLVPDADALETMHRADLALYAAKENGRGQAKAYMAHIEHERRNLLDLEEKLKHAIQADEIFVVFQPLVCAVSGNIQGVEALARWVPSTGPISPSVFIPLAEKSGLIERLSRKVLETAVASVSALPGLELSINISPLQLANIRFAEEIEGVLSDHGFDAHRLTLEVTEGALISQPDRACRSIKALRARGVRFAMDDFGAGYASIGTLRQFEFDKVKIDRSLIASDDHAVVRATIQLAKALQITVTAEGIETEDQAQFARSAGCELLQGYLLGKPMPFEELSRRVSATNSHSSSFGEYRMRT